MSQLHSVLRVLVVGLLGASGCMPPNAPASPNCCAAMTRHRDGGDLGATPGDIKHSESAHPGTFLAANDVDPATTAQLVNETGGTTTAPPEPTPEQKAAQKAAEKLAKAKEGAAKVLRKAASELTDPTFLQTERAEAGRLADTLSAPTTPAPMTEVERLKADAEKARAKESAAATLRDTAIELASLGTEPAVVARINEIANAIAPPPPPVPLTELQKAQAKESFASTLRSAALKLRETGAVAEADQVTALANKVSPPPAPKAPTTP